jgi:hypothetical protein
LQDVPHQRGLAAAEETRYDRDRDFARLHPLLRFIDWLPVAGMRLPLVSSVTSVTSVTSWRTINAARGVAIQDCNPEKHDENCRPHAASPRHRSLQVLIRSGRYPG